MALNGWSEMADARATAKRRALSVVRAMQGSGVRKAWMSWRANNEARHAMKLAVARMLNRAYFSALGTWRATAAQTLELQRQLRRMLKSWSPTGRAIRKALNSWLEAVAEAHCMRRALSSLTRRRERVVLLSLIHI